MSEPDAAKAPAPAAPAASTPAMRFAPPPKGETVRQRLARYAILALTVYLIWCTSLYFSQDRLIFPGAFSAAVRGAVPTPPRGVERVTLKMSDGAPGAAWLALGSGRTPESPGPAVVFFHGNHETIEGSQLLLSEYTRRGVSVLVPEYRGFGGLEGQPSQAALVSDGVQWLEWLVTQPEIDPSRLVLHGRSLGGGVAAQVAHALETTSRTTPPGPKIAALITESTFTSVASFAAGYGVPTFLVRHPFRTDRVLPGFTFPILIMHGEQDTIIPASHARRLGELQPAATVVLLEGDHNDFPRDFRAYVRTIEEFLERAGILTPPDAPDSKKDPA